MDGDQAPTPTPTTTDAGAPPSGPLRSTTGRAWTLKTLGFAIALGVLGYLGYQDAYFSYPARGRLHADFMLRNYLQEADQAFQLPTASVEDPAAEYRRLSELAEGTLNPVERARLAWLRSVSRVADLSGLTRENRAELDQRTANPAHRADTHTMFADARRTLMELDNVLATSSQPKPLAAYDLPVQFLFLYGGAGGCLYLLGLFFLVRSRVYKYDPAEHRLTLPSGKSIVPADIAMVDKRQWDKYIVHLRLADGSPEVRLDLYRHSPLENWVLEMEKLAPGYTPPEEEAGTDASTPTADAEAERV